MTGGRPLRFLALALGGWVLIRVAMLLPDMRERPVSDVLPRLIKVLVPNVAAAVFEQWPIRLPAAAANAIALPAVAPIQSPALIAASEPRSPQPYNVAVPTARTDDTRQIDTVPIPLAPPVSVRGPSRLSGTAWLLVRGGAGGTVSGGQLGASQGGVRITYALGNRHRVALAARIATPLKGEGREVALGIEWQPTRLPIRFIAERRVVLDGGRGGPTLGVIAGYGPSDIAPGMRLEAYGQAGAIARDGIEGFVDASARVTHAFGTVAGVRIDVGVGAWGSAQRAVERFDIGPSVVATMPVAGKAIRMTLDWRARIAGAARPGSGPAFSIGSDF